MPFAASPSHLYIYILYYKIWVQFISPHSLYQQIHSKSSEITSHIPTTFFIIIFQLSHMKSIMASNLTSSSLHYDSALLLQVSSNFKHKIPLWVLELLVWISMHFYNNMPIHRMHTLLLQMSLTHWVKLKPKFYAQILHRCLIVLFLAEEPIIKLQPIFPPRHPWGEPAPTLVPW